MSYDPAPTTSRFNSASHHLFTENVVNLGKEHKNAAYAAAGPAALAENVVGIVAAPFWALETTFRATAQEARVAASKELAEARSAEFKEFAKKEKGFTKVMLSSGPKMVRVKAVAACALAPLTLAVNLVCVPFIMLWRVVKIPLDTYRMVQEIKKQSQIKGDGGLDI